jgi:hypothetical protein
VPPEPKNAQALKSLEADERAAQLPDAPSTTMNAFASGYAFETAQRMANALASSSVVPKAYIGQPANCLIAMEVASRMQMSVIAVMQNLDIVHGTPSWRSKFLIAMANSSKKFSRLKWRWFGTEGKDDWGARAFATDLVDGEVLVGPLVTIAIAKAEGWYDRSGTKWKTIPELMIMYRSAGWWSRLYDPEDSMGFGTVEEAEDVHGVEFDRKLQANPALAHPIGSGMAPVPGAAEANTGRRMSLGKPAATGPVIDAKGVLRSDLPGRVVVVDNPEQAAQEIADALDEPSAVARPAAPTGEQLPLGGTPTRERQPGEDDDEANRAAAAPTAEEIAARDAAGKGK